MPLPGHQDISLSQILRIITTSGIERAISGFSEDNQVKRFNDNNHLIVMPYERITGKDSLKDTVKGLKVHSNKLYHLCIRSFLRSSLSKTNKKRDRRIFRDT